MIPREERGPVLNGLPTTLPDVDPEETQEWIESLDKMVENDGPNRARIVLLKMLERARSHSRLGLSALTSTDYINTIAAEDEEEYPGDAEIERNIRRLLRWNSAITVHRAQRPGIGVGGHISTYASAVTLYEVSQNHFWRGQDAPGGGDQVFFQGHAAPGVYARAFLEGVSARTISMGSVRRSRRPGMVYPLTRTLACCPTSGSSRRCRWVWARWIPFTRRL